MVAGLLLLVARHSVVSDSPLIGSFQIVAIGLMIWARITFGRRSFHLSAGETEGTL